MNTHNLAIFFFYTKPSPQLKVSLHAFHVTNPFQLSNWFFAIVLNKNLSISDY